MPREPGWWYRDPGLHARVLSPIASLYGAIAARRLKRGKPYRARIPVICIGNFTSGGSGKTPLTALIAEMLIARGEYPAILSRGYGGSERGPHWVNLESDTAERVGDEPLLLARIAPVMVARDRGAGARAIEDQGEATIIVMDDGLQNPSLRKDLSLAVIDSARAFGNGQVIPAGPLRLPLAEQAKLVQGIVFNGPVYGHFAGEVERLVPVPQLNAWLQGEWIGGGQSGGGKFVAYAGIGHPQRFFDTARALGATLAETVPFPDHAPYTDADADRLLALARAHDAKLITTAKDHVRLTGSEKLRALAAASQVVPVRMKLHDSAVAALEGMLERVLAKH